MGLAQGGLQVVARQHHSQVVARHHSKDAPVRTTVSLIRETSRSWADSLPFACFRVLELRCSVISDIYSNLLRLSS